MRNFNTLRTRGVASAALLTGLGAAVLNGCGTEYTVAGVVHKGDDGQEYVIPDNAHRPVYADKADCVADVSVHEKQSEQATGAQVDPNDACQPVTEYHPVLYPGTYYYGVLTSGEREWKSTRVVTWSPVKDGQFAAEGETLQHNVAATPDGTTEGEHASIQEHEGGFFDESGEDGVHGGVEDEPHISVHGGE